MGGWAVGWAHPRLGAEQSCSTEPRGARGRSSSRRSRCPASAAGSRRQGRPAGTAGDQSWGTRGSHPPWGPSTCRLPARPGRSPPAPRPRPPPPPPPGPAAPAWCRSCCTAAGCPRPARRLCSGCRGSRAGALHPAGSAGPQLHRTTLTWPSGPRAGWGSGDWGLGPGVPPPPTGWPWHLSDADGGLSPRADAEALVL